MFLLSTWAGGGGERRRVFMRKVRGIFRNQKPKKRVREKKKLGRTDLRNQFLLSLFICIYKHLNFVQFMIKKLKKIAYFFFSNTRPT